LRLVGISISACYLLVPDIGKLSFWSTSPMIFQLSSERISSWTIVYADCGTAIGTPLPSTSPEDLRELASRIQCLVSEQ